MQLASRYFSPIMNSGGIRSEKLSYKMKGLPSHYFSSVSDSGGIGSQMFSYKMKGLLALM